MDTDVEEGQRYGIRHRGTSLTLVTALITVESWQHHREESRGGHFRGDFPERDDDNFMKRSMIYLDPSSPTAGIRQATKPVIFTRYEPMERKY